MTIPTLPGMAPTFAERQPLILWSSILVTLQIIAGGAALGDFVGLKVAGLLILIVAALQAGTQFYLRSLVTANVNVAARVDRTSGEVLAGQALPKVPDDTPVTIIADPPFPGEVVTPLPDDPSPDFH